jgi:uncharacterized damage-inducible protein DinB
MVRTETVLDSWKTVREDTAQAVEDFPEPELEFRPTPELMTFGEIARHILGAGHALTGLMLAGVDNFAVPEFREMLKKQMPPLGEKPDKTALAADLRKLMDQRHEELARQPAEFFSAIMTRFDGQRVTRLEMLQFIKEHELTHRSQLFMYLRLKGVVPATTRRRQAQKQS